MSATASGTHPFQEFAAGLIAQLASGAVLTKAGRKASPNTVSSLTTALRRVERYERTTCASEMTPVWFSAFLRHLLAAELRHNTIATTVKQVKILLHRQCETQDLALRKLPPTPRVEQVTKVYSSPADLARLAALELSGSRRVARDAYLIQCRTGMRFSDLQRVLADARAYSSELGGKHYMRFTQQKTNAEATVPLSSTVLLALERHGWKLTLKTPQWYNGLIKQVAEQAGLTQPVTITYTRGGERQHETRPKWGRMSSHTARRSFATNAFLAGVPVSKIMRITGHTSEAAFRVYVQADGLESAISVAHHPFFA